MRILSIVVPLALALVGCSTASSPTTSTAHGPDLASPGGQCDTGSDCLSGACLGWPGQCGCSGSGVACSTSADCCDTTQACVAGTCAFACTAGQACTPTGTCDVGVTVCPGGSNALGGCQDTGQSTCGTGQVCANGTCYACVGNGQLADYNGPCCSEMSEPEIPDQPNSVDVCCSGTGGACSSDGDCCVGYGSCVQGVCAQPPPTCVDGESYTMSVEWNQSTGQSWWACTTPNPQTGGCYCPSGCMAYGPGLGANPFPTEGPATFQCQ